jgi:hypothetical protein
MTNISKIENGHKKFPFSHLHKLAEFIQKDIEELKTIYLMKFINMNVLIKYFLLQRGNQNT